MIEQEGNNFQYEVSYRLVGAAQFLRRNVSNSTYSLRIKTVQFKQYEICVKAYNEKGPALNPLTCIKAYSYQSSKY